MTREQAEDRLKRRKEALANMTREAAIERLDALHVLQMACRTFPTQSEKERDKRAVQLDEARAALLQACGVPWGDSERRQQKRQEGG